MANTVILSDRDVAMLRLLDKTPATAALVLKSSVTFGRESFLDERRVRERLQTLEEGRLVRSFLPAHTTGGAAKWFKLSRGGFVQLHGAEDSLPPRSKFDDIPPSRFEHTRVLAEVIVHTLVAAYRSRVPVTGFHGDGTLVLETGSSRQVPDCHFQFASVGKTFNVLFEIDNSTEPLTTDRLQSIRAKIAGYEAYQDTVWYNWKRGGERSPRPYFRVVFLTKTVERAHHILWLAGQCARNRDRRLCYAATQESYLRASNALHAFLFHDHHGGWTCLVDLHPTAKILLAPIRLSAPLGSFPRI